MKIASVKGMNDVLPTASAEEASFHGGVWAEVVGAAQRVFSRYAFDEIRTPIVEEAALFARALGESTDVVGKEMYAFPERGGDKLLALRPEGTAGAVRAFLEKGLGANDPVQRWCYFGPMFRHERQQKHRYRQFYQLGVEALGVAAPELDVEVLALCRDIVLELELPGVELRLNSLGDPADRAAYVATLKSFLAGREEKLCGECRARLEKNPLRVLDCKNEGCRAQTAEVPASWESLGPAAKEHFERVRAGLDALQVPYVLDKRLVRGLDYYCRTTFELLATSLGSGQQTAAGGGGRYDGLVELLGGPPTPAVGFAMGVERLCALRAQVKGLPKTAPELFLAIADEAGRARALPLVQALRKAGHRVEVDWRGGKVGKQLNRADKRGAKFSLVLGQAEVASGRGKVKRMRDGAETEVALDALAASLVDPEGN